MAKNPRRDETGNVYGRLKVLAIAPENSKAKYAKTYWICVCICGNFKSVEGSKLRSGHTQSCGCLRPVKKYLLHGHAAGKEKASPTYASWAAMHTRCNNANSGSYDGYGAKGIEVCHRWKSFSNFLEDMGERPEGASIDRLDNSKGYAPENCKWSTRTEQARNRKMCLAIDYAGETKSLAEWCERLGLSYNQAYHQVRTRGLSLEQAIQRLSKS